MNTKSPPKYKIITFNQEWLDDHGWMTNAFDEVQPVESNGRLIGLYTNPSDSEYYKFEIHQNHISQELPLNRLAIIQRFTVKIYQRHRSGEKIWMESWSKYMDGLKVVWFRDSANIHHRFDVPENYMPTTQVAFFRKTYRSLLSYHGDAADLFHEAMTSANLSPAEFRNTIQNPFHQLTQDQVRYQQRIDEFKGYITGLPRITQDFIMLWLVSTGRIQEVTRAEQDVEKARVNVELTEWVSETVSRIYKTQLDK